MEKCPECNGYSLSIGGDFVCCSRCPYKETPEQAAKDYNKAFGDFLEGNEIWDCPYCSASAIISNHDKKFVCLSCGEKDAWNQCARCKRPYNTDDYCHHCAEQDGEA